MTYSIDFRKAVMDHCDEKGNLTATSRLFGVSRLTIYTWQKLKKETGTLNPQPIKRPFRKIDPEVLAQRVSDYPNATLKEHANYFGACIQSVSVALRKLNITRKKK